MKKHLLSVGLFATVLAIALMMLMPVNATAQGTWQKVTLFEDDFNTNLTVDWTSKWATEGNQSYFDIQYRALELSADWDDTGTENWSNMIHTKYGYLNDTLYETDDFYYDHYFVTDPPVSVYKGFVDQYYLNTSTLKEYAGICGALFEHEWFGEESYQTIKVWWVDTTNTYYEYNTTLEYISHRWYTVSILYNMTTDFATVTILDTVTQDYVMKNITHLKTVVEDVKMFAYAYYNWVEPPPESIMSPMSVNPPKPQVDLSPVCYIDNVEIYTYDFVVTPVTPPVTPTPTEKNYIYELGQWLIVIGGIIAVVGLIAYSELEGYLAKAGYLNSGALATSVAVAGGLVALAGVILWWNPMGWVLPSLLGWKP